MTKVYLIRHAEAEGNLYRRIQGHYDGQITRRGQQQIEVLAERFKDIPIDALYSSDLTRTIKTAGAIQKYHDLELRCLPSLREINMGAWEDRTWGDIELEDPEQLYNFSSDPAAWEIEDGESFAALGERMYNTVRALAARHEGQTIAVVSHGMAIRTLICTARGIPSEQVDRIPHGDNTCVALFEVEGDKMDVVFCNDNSHLPESISTLAKQNWWKGSSGADKNNLRFEPLDLKKEREFYVKSYAETWELSHGTREDFQPELYLQSAKNHVKAHPQALMKVMQGGEAIGLIELDTEREAESGVGWISLCYMVPEHRGRNLAVQMIGHAVSVYRGLGRKVLRLHAAEKNERAVSFYERYGFERIGTERGLRGLKLLLEMEI